MRSAGQQTDYHGTPHARCAGAQQRDKLALGTAATEPGDHVHDPENCALPPSSHEPRDGWAAE